MARIVTIIGARPQFIKAAVVSRFLRDHPRLEDVIVHTGQHYDASMSERFFEELEIPPPDYNLKISGGLHGAMTGRMLEAIEQALLELKPSIVLIYGDTNSTLAGALAAAKLHIPLAHVEAGLRSFNRRMPEEINRIVADKLSDLLFCPTRTAVEHLANEGITQGVHLVGDVMYDAAVFARDAAENLSTILEDQNLTAGDYALCTLHRAENTVDGARLRSICEYLEKQAQDGLIVLPVHPRTRNRLNELDLKMDGVRLIEPVGYFDIHRLLQGARLVYTDSGGLQKEAYFHRVECITLREETEWTETIESGWNRLWRVDHYEGRREIDEYGDGRAGAQIIDVIDEWLRTNRESEKQ